MSFFTEMLIRIIITIIIEEGILCWLLITRPDSRVLVTVGIISVTIISLAVQFWFVMHRYGIVI